MITKKAIFTATIVEILIVLCRAVFGFIYAGKLSIILYILAYIFIRRSHSTEKELRITIVCFITVYIFFNILPRIFDFEDSLSSLPESIVHISIIIAGWLFFTFKVQPKRKKIFPILILTIVSLFFSSNYGYGLWLHYLNYNTIFGTVTPYQFPNFTLLDEKKINTDAHSKLETEETLLYFWHTACGSCIKTFPYLDSLYQTLTDNSSISIYAVNVKLKSDSMRQSYDLVNKLGYSFPVFVIDDSIALNSMKIDKYPTTLIVNKQNNITFRGSLLNAIKYLQEL